MGEKDLIFLGACLLLGGKGNAYTHRGGIPQEVLDSAVNSSKEIFKKVFDTEE